MSDAKVEREASIIPFGLTALSIATLVMGLAAIFQSRTAAVPYFMMALLFGGVGEFLAGMWAFAYRESTVATDFSLLGLFYAWFGLTNLISVSGAAETIADVNAASMGIVFLIGAAMTLYLWAGSVPELPGFNLTLLFLWISFVVLAISLFTGLYVVSIAGGVVAITASVIAAITAFTGLGSPAGLGELLMVHELARKAREKLAETIGPVDQFARNAREKLAEKIRPHDAPPPSNRA
jgi:succinate-acetate transporter protein